MSVSFSNKVNYDLEITKSERNFEKNKAHSAQVNNDFKFDEFYEKTKSENRDHYEILNQSAKNLMLHHDDINGFIKKLSINLRILASSFQIFFKIGQFFSNIGKAISNRFTILTPNFVKLGMFASKFASLIKKIMNEKEQQKIEINIYNDNRLYLSLQKSEQDKHGRRRSLSLPPETIRRIASQHYAKAK